MWILSPIIIPVLLVITAAIYHLMVLLLAGGGQGFEATFRVVAYSVGPQLFQVVPFCGGFVSFVWGVVLQIVGMQHVHRVSGLKAVAIVLAPLVVCGGLFGALLFLTFAFREG